MPWPGASDDAGRSDGGAVRGAAAGTEPAEGDADGCLVWAETGGDPAGGGEGGPAGEGKGGPAGDAGGTWADAAEPEPGEAGPDWDADTMGIVREFGNW